MSDFKDMLGIPRANPNTTGGGGGGGPGKTKKASSKKETKPKGMSREVADSSGNQLMGPIRTRQEDDDERVGGGDAEKNAVADKMTSLVPTHAGLKMKRKVSARKVSWSWQAFRNSARTDGLM